MKTTSQQRIASREAAFTIIETLIVLAVAGLILMIVLLAIPALQRSSRNNQRRQDVQAVLAAVSHWELNHSGNMPDPTVGDNYLQYTQSKLSLYDPGSIKIEGGSSGWSPATNSPPYPDPVTDVGQIYVYNYQKCDAATQGKSIATGAGYSDIVALYALETSNSFAPQCQQL
jgi:type II secretory pathway pseudopilin PulG